MPSSLWALLVPPLHLEGEEGPLPQGRTLRLQTNSGGLVFWGTGHVSEDHLLTLRTTRRGSNQCRGCRGWR